MVDEVVTVATEEGAKRSATALLYEARAKFLNHAISLGRHSPILKRFAPRDMHAEEPTNEDKETDTPNRLLASGETRSASLRRSTVPYRTVPLLLRRSAVPQRSIALSFDFEFTEAQRKASTFLAHSRSLARI